MTIQATPGRAAVFLDRDGVLNCLVERDGRLVSPRLASEFKIVPGVREVVNRLRNAGFLVFVVTNQPDVARGLLPRHELDLMTEQLRQTIPVEEIVICPHDDVDDCACRKPRPGMLTDLAERWGLDLRRSYFVGDSWKDLAAAEAAGCSGLRVAPQVEGNPFADSTHTLSDAVGQILAGSGRRS